MAPVYIYSIVLNISILKLLIDSALIPNLNMHAVQGPGCENCCQLLTSRHRCSRNERGSRRNVSWNVFKVRI